MPRFAGAGGNWTVFGERPDPRIIVQLGPTHCSAACMAMILKDRGIFASQEEIADRCGVPTSAASIARTLNQLDPQFTWAHGYIARGFEVLMSQSPWIALVKDLENPLLHAVIVDGIEGDRVSIRDPFPPGTRYRVALADLENPERGWTGVAVFIQRSRKSQSSRGKRPRKAI